MKIITSLLAATLLLAGITLATAQTGCSDCQPLPTNPPSPSEGGQPPGGQTNVQTNVPKPPPPPPPQQGGNKNVNTDGKPKCDPKLQKCPP